MLLVKWRIIRLKSGASRAGEKWWGKWGVSPVWAEACGGAALFLGDGSLLSSAYVHNPNVATFSAAVRGEWCGGDVSDWRLGRAVAQLIRTAQRRARML